LTTPVADAGPLHTPWSFAWPGGKLNAASDHFF